MTGCCPSWVVEPHSRRGIGEVWRERRMGMAQLVGCRVLEVCVVVHGGGKVVCVGQSLVDA